MIARTEEFVFHQINDLQWRFGMLEEGHSITITNSDKNDKVDTLCKMGLFVVREEENGKFFILGRAVEVDLEPIQL